MLLIFGALSNHRVQTDGAICADGENGFQLCFYGPPNDLFQFLGIYLQIVAWAVLSRLRAAAMEIRLLVCDMGSLKRAAEHNTFQKILPLLLMRLGKATYSFLHLIK